MRFTRDCAAQFLTRGMPLLPWDYLAAHIRLLQRFNLCYCHRVPPETRRGLSRFLSSRPLCGPCERATISWTVADRAKAISGERYSDHCTSVERRPSDSL